MKGTNQTVFAVSGINYLNLYTNMYTSTHRHTQLGDNRTRVFYCQNQKATDTFTNVLTNEI